MNYKLATLDESIRLIRQRLGMLIEGAPSLQFDELGCPILISALKGRYRLEDNLRQNQKDPLPKKDGYYDHPADAYRYGVWNLFSGTVENESAYDGELPTNLGYGGAYG